MHPTPSPDGPAAAAPAAVANFHGRPARGRPDVLADAAGEVLDGHWGASARYDRMAEVTDARRLTSTGTVWLAFQVVDHQPFSFLPGQYVGIEHRLPNGARRRSPYCIMPAPAPDGRFELVVRVVPDGPVSRYLGGLVPGDRIVFRGPLGPSMVPHDGDRDLVLMATGVGVGPFLSLARHLLESGFERRITLFWGLREEADVCLTDRLDQLAADHPGFGYRISLSQPPPGWGGLVGRLTESVPAALERLGTTRFYLCGNGAMTEELRLALSDLGVSERFLYTEPYFNRRHRPDPEVLAGIRSRFVACDLFSPQAHRAQRGLALDSADDPGTGGNADPRSPSDVTIRVPDFLGPGLGREGERVGAGRP
ncbi:MAG: FAD-binding oxidoreductase [Acidimicrobiales bacterium]